MTVEPLELSNRLGRWDRGQGPLYRQLASALRSLLEAGELPRGAVLPPERRLASALAVSRTTVTAAYTELRADGWLEARQGSATTVAVTRRSPMGAHRANGIFATLLRTYDVDIDLTVNVPDASPVVERVLSNPSAHLDVGALSEGHGYHPAGHPRLRHDLARVLTDDGLPTEPDQVLVTSGAQQAVSLAIRGLTHRGDTVAVEETTYPGALDVISEAGLVPTPLAMTADGVSLDDLRRTVRDRSPRLVYLIPSFHNPTSTVLSEVDRRRVVRMVASERITVIDDMTLADLDFATTRPPPLSSLEPDAPIVTIGSMSKVYWGGLRIGWVRAHETIITHLAGLKVSADMGTSSPTQVMASAMLGFNQEARRWRHARLRDSLDALTGALEQHLPEWQWERPSGGPQLWVRLPDTDATGFAQRALRDGIALVPGPMLAAVPGIATDRIRIPLYPPPQTLEKAVARLAGFWHQ